MFNLKYKKYIGHIHIKDKNSKLQNVPLNTGLVDISKNTNTLDFKCFENLSTFTNYLIING